MNLNMMFEKLLNSGATAPVSPISRAEHKKLIEKISQLPVGDKDSAIYRRSLAELFEKYEKQMRELEETSLAYHEIAELIKQKQPLTNTMKYARVRRLQPV